MTRPAPQLSPSALVRGREARDCVHCGTSFVPRTPSQRFCGQTCEVRARRARYARERRPYTCAGCGETFYSRSPETHCLDCAEPEVVYADDVEGEDIELVLIFDEPEPEPEDDLSPPATEPDPAPAPEHPAPPPTARPRTRGECLDGPRPCPWVSCRYHMATAHGRTWWARSDDEIAEDVATMPTSCVLDVADEGGVTLDGIGEPLGLTRERIRQIESKAMKGLRRGLRREGVDLLDLLPAHIRGARDA